MIGVLVGAMALAADAPPRTVAAADRTVLKEMTWQGAPMALSVGPCTRTACPLAVGRGAKDARRWVTVYDLGGVDTPSDTFAVDALDDAVQLTFSEYNRDTVSWSPHVDVVGKPTLEIQLAVGVEHVARGSILVSLVDGVVWPVWTQSVRPRYMGGGGGFEVVSVASTPVIVTLAPLPKGTEHETHEAISRETYRWDGAAFVYETEVAVPSWLVIAATLPTAEEAFARRDKTRCLEDFAVLSTGDYPRLQQGLTVIAQELPSRALAEQRLKAATACEAEAYLKQGR